VRRLLALLPVLAFAAATAPQQPAAASAARPQAVPARNVLVISIDGTTIHDWARYPNLLARVTEGASAVLSTRAGSDERNAVKVEEAAYATVGAGRRMNAGAEGTALARRLQATGHGGIDLLGDQTAANILGARYLSSGQSTPAGPAAAVTWAVLQGTDGLARADALAQAVTLEPGSTLVILSTYTSAYRRAHHIYLGAIAIDGFGFTKGLLRSPSTRRDGVVTLADVAPTILMAAGVTPLASMGGRAVEQVESTDPVAAVERLDDRYVQAARIRAPLLRGFVWFALVVLAGVALAIAGRRERRLRIPIRIALTVVATVPLGLFLEPVLPHGGSTLLAILVVAGFALVVGAAASLLGTSAGMAAVSGVTVVTVIVDLALRGPLASRAPISYLIADGSRFYGIGNELMGVLVAAMLVALAVAFDRRAVAPLAGATAMTIVIALMGAPTVGAKLGSLFVAVPAFGLLAASAGGRKPSWWLALAFEIVAGAATGILILADRLRPAAQRSHIGQVGGAGTGATVARKIGAALRLLALSIWMVALLIVLALAGVVWRTRGDDVRRVLGARSHLRASLAGGGLAIVGALAFNDAGTIAAALIAILLAAALFAEVSASR